MNFVLISKITQITFCINYKNCKQVQLLCTDKNSKNENVWLKKNYFQVKFLPKSFL